MKKILSLVILLTSGSLLFAQTKFGIKAGANFANVITKESGTSTIPSYLTSFNVGGLAEIKLNSTFYFQPGLSVSGKCFKIDVSKSESGFNYTSSGKLSLIYLEVPLNFLAKFQAGSGNFYVGTGPYLGYAIKGNAKYEEKLDGPGTTDDFSNKTDEKITFGSKPDDIKPLDLGLTLLTGYEMSSGLYLQVGYGLGLNNISNDEGSSVKNKVISVSLGFKF